jgi:hypothetical protein
MIETVNFRLYFKVIIRQNEIQYVTYSIYIQSKSGRIHDTGKRGLTRQRLSYQYLDEERPFVQKLVAKEGPSFETSNFSLYFSGGCIPPNETTKACYYWHYTGTVHSYIALV